MAGPVGMSVPGASSLFQGGLLANQAGVETDDERRKRMLAQQQQKMLPGATPGASSLGLAPTGYSLAGGMGL